MNFSNELRRLKAKLDRIAPIVSPPQLRVVMLGANEEAPDNLTIWDLPIRIENKNPIFNR